MRKASIKSAPDAELNDLASSVGEFIEYWGFKRVHGRLWTHLFLSETPLDAGELLSRLGISKALASMTLNDLLRYDVILPAGKSPRGTDLFCANPDTLGVILNVLRQREREMLAKVREALSRLETAQPKGSEQMAQLATMVENAQSFLEALLLLQDMESKNWSNLTRGFLTMPGNES